MNELVKSDLPHLALVGVKKFDESTLADVLAIVEECSQENIEIFRCSFSMNKESVLDNLLSDPNRFYNILYDTYHFDRDKILEYYKPNAECLLVDFMRGLHDELLFHQQDNEMSPCGLYCDTTYYKITKLDEKKAVAFVRLSPTGNDDEPYVLGLTVWKQS